MINFSFISCSNASTFPTFLSFCTPMLHISSISCTIATTFPTFPSLLRTDATHFLYFLYQRLLFPLISPPFPHRCYIFPSFPVPSLPHFQPFCPFAHRCYTFPLFLAPSLPHFRPFLPYCAPMLHISSISCTNASFFPSYHPHFRTVATYFHHFLYHRFHISNLSVLLHTDATYFRNFLHHRYHISNLSFPSAHRCYIFPLFLAPSLPTALPGGRRRRLYI